MIFNSSVFVMFILMVIKSGESPHLRPIDHFTVHMKVKLELNDPGIVQIRKFYYPSVYETNLYKVIRLDDAFFVIGEVSYNNNLIYGDSPVLLNRFVQYTMSRPGLQIIHIASYYLDKSNYYENVEFICDFYETTRVNDPPMSEGASADGGSGGLRYRENIHKLINIDLEDLNSLPLTLETRFREGKMEIFLSDLFKIFLKIGTIRYKNFIIDNNVLHCYYRSLTCKFDGSLIYVNVLTLLNNAKRNEIKYTVNTEGTTQEECVQKTETKTFIMTNLP